MAKKQKCPEFENHERWLVAYADMMTLLFALFVVLYAIATADADKLKKVSVSIQKALGMSTEQSEGPEGTPRGNNINEGIFKKVRGNTNRDSRLTRNRREVTAIISADFKKLERELFDRLYGKKPFPEQEKAARENRVVYVNRDPDGIRVTLLARKFFRASSTGLNDEARAALDGVAGAVKSMGRVVRVEGHTDNLPFNANGMTNWELSAGRAASVVRYFVASHKFDAQMIYAAGFADTKPVAANDSPENRALNRRVDIKILYDQPSEEMPADAGDGEIEPSEEMPADAGDGEIEPSEKGP
jgi:chemotaxis protein MotB